MLSFKWWENLKYEWGQVVDSWRYWRGHLCVALILSNLEVSIFYNRISFELKHLTQAFSKFYVYMYVCTFILQFFFNGPSTSILNFSLLILCMLVAIFFSFCLTKMQFRGYYLASQVAKCVYLWYGWNRYFS